MHGWAGIGVVRGCAHGTDTKTRGPRAEHGFVGQGVLPTPEEATAATSMACRQGGQTGQVEVLLCVGGCAHPINS